MGNFDAEIAGTRVDFELAANATLREILQGIVWIGKR
jgi:hypothetical protein